MGGAEDMSNDHLDLPESHIPMNSRLWAKALKLKARRLLFRPSDQVKYYSEQWTMLLEKKYSPATMPATREASPQDHEAVLLTLESNLAKSGIRVKQILIESIEHLNKDGTPLRVYHVRAEVW